MPKVRPYLLLETSPSRLADTIANRIAPQRAKGPAPTLSEFFPRFLEKYARANDQKPRGIESKEAIFRLHLVPFLGSKRLSEITEMDVQELKLALSEKKPKTINNVLTTLNKLLKMAVRWRELAEMPVTVDFLRTELPDVAFYDFPQYRKLVREARAVDLRSLLVVLLGGDAGLRRNEMLALAPADVNLAHGLLTIRHQEHRGRLILPKGNRPRVVPLTNALAKALADALPKAGRRILARDDGSPPTIQSVRTWMAWAQKAAGLPNLGAPHLLRHTFCSHLAMRGATVLAIRELAGHKSLRTTMRYMHLSPNERARAIALLNKRTLCYKADNQGSR